MKKVGKIVGCTPVGSCILIERLTDEEISQSPVILPNASKSINLPQGYILEIGPAVPRDSYKFEVGDRVLLVGTSNPVPDYGDGHRKRELVEPHTVRAILKEE